MAGRPCLSRTGGKVARLMEFAILGPLRVGGPAGSIEIRAPKQRALLAMLLLSYRDDAVSSGRLIDVLWDEDPPPTAAKAPLTRVRRSVRLPPA